MDELFIVNKVQKIIKEKYQNISESMMAGTVDNMEKYKYMLGQAHAYQIVLQEISNLLEPKEQKVEHDNIIELGKGSSKT